MLQSWSDILGPGDGGLVHTADGSALASSTTLTDITPAPNVIIPANSLHVGQAFAVRAFGRFGTTGTPTLLLGLYAGAVAGTSLGTTGAITTTSGVTTVPWWLEAIIIVRSIGASGSLFTQGKVHGISGTVGVSTVPIPASAPAAVTVDTTAAKALTVGAQWGTNNASNTITCHGLVIQRLN